MDLQTIQTNIRNKVYSTATQFHSDVKKIINNSYLFNQYNEDFLKLTSQFEKYYLKISADPNARAHIFSNLPNNNKKKKGKKSAYKSEGTQQAVTLAEKKELALEIRSLPKEHLLEVVQLAHEDGLPIGSELDLDSLPTSKIRELQKLVREKLVYIKMNPENNRPQPQNNNDARSEESSFESDSDS